MIFSFFQQKRYGLTWNRLVLLLFLSLVLHFGAVAQSTMYVRQGCAVNEAEMGKNHYVFDPSDEAQLIIKIIMDANFLEPNFVIKSGDVENALATTEGGQRFILYNTTYVERIKKSGGSDWPAFYVFAHEIAHHLNNHRFDLSDNPNKSKEQELKADQYAGAMLYRLGASLDQAQKGIGTDFKENGSNTHPPRSARMEAIANGWKKAYDQSGGNQPKPVQINFSTSKEKEPDETDAEVATITDKLVGTFVLVKGGTFKMGCTDEQIDCSSDEEPVRDVTLSDYYIGQTEVTQAQWKAVMKISTSPAYFKCDECPVENVSWDDVQTFIEKLNTRSGGVTYRLPTEAEWEYAARGGRYSKGYMYAGGGNLEEVAWYSSNSEGKTHPVKGKKANELGLYDMSGNVWEWCSDWKENYPENAQSNPKGPSIGSYRVIRGGSWISVPQGCRVADRSVNAPGDRSSTLGFRLARTK